MQMTGKTGCREASDWNQQRVAPVASTGVAFRDQKHRIHRASNTTASFHNPPAFWFEGVYNGFLPLCGPG
jgi:hypothetical protein